MECLPDLVMVEILKLLSYRDLLNVSITSSRLNKLSTYDKLWEYHCKRIWLIMDISEQTTWKDEFIAHYKKYHNYLSSFKEIKSCWIAMENFLSEHCPEIYQTLNPGIDEEVLSRFEDVHKVSLPSDYKVSYLIHNGQTCDIPGQYGVFGGIFLPHESFFCSGLCKFDTAIESYSAQCQYALPITHTQSLKLSVAQLVLPNDWENKHISHNTELIAFREGHYCSIAESFTEWFSGYVEKLTKGHYEIWQGNILLYDKDTEVTAVTNYIKVSVRWSYNHTFNTIISSSNLYTYHITMSMADDAPESESCKLMTRHWEINDENGEAHVVDGDGVVGYYPVMQPGAKFSWRSYTTFQTIEGGSMKGHFTMYYLSNRGRMFNVTCPEFKMRRPPMSQPKWTESGSFNAH